MIQSFSDIITNSSSEVFILDTKDHAGVAQFLSDICNLLNLNLGDLVDFESVTRDSSYYYKGPKIKKGNLLITEKYDNALPDVISAVIKSLGGWNPNIPEVKRVEVIHCG